MYVFDYFRKLQTTTPIRYPDYSSNIPTLVSLRPMKGDWGSNITSNQIMDGGMTCDFTAF